jgi:hypothetical protein
VLLPDAAGPSIATIMQSSSQIAGKFTIHLIENQ